MTEECPHPGPLPVLRERGQIGGRYKLLILLYGLALLLPGLSSRTLTRHEVLAAYPAKEMLAGRGWIIPMFAGIPRDVKPPATGWLIAGCMAITRSDAEWAPRIPSVIAGIATGLLMAWFTARYLGEAMGVLAGLIQLTCYGTIMQARLAEADMLVAAATVASMTCFGRAVLDDGKPSRLFSILFHLFAGMAFLLKGVPLLFIVAAVINYAAVRKGGRVWHVILDPIGLTLLAALVLAWPMAAYLMDPAILETFRHETFGRMAGEVSHDPIYTYVRDLPLMLVPWLPIMAYGVYIAFKQGLHRWPLFQLLLSWLIPGIVLLHFSAQKHKHYALPMLPPMAIFGAIGLWELVNRLQQRRMPVVSTFTVILIAAVIVNAIVVPRSDDDYRNQKTLALSANAIAPPAATIYIIDESPSVEPQVAYYLRPPILRFRNPTAFAEFTQAHPAETIHFIASDHQLPVLVPLGELTSLAQAAPRKKDPGRLRQQFYELTTANR